MCRLLLLHCDTTGDEHTWRAWSLYKDPSDEPLLLLARSSWQQQAPSLTGPVVLRERAPQNKHAVQTACTQSTQI